MAMMFKRVRAGLHRAAMADDIYELERDLSAKTKFSRQWRLYKFIGPERTCIDTFIDTIAEGNRSVEFITLVEAHLRKLGGSEGGYYQWTLQTRLGPLFISPHGDRVMMRFDDVDKAKVELGERLYNHNGFNPFSGKWNMHWSADMSSAIKMLSFERQIDRVM